MHLKTRIKHAIKHSFFIAGLLSIIWFLLRTGTKPSRITYPCQQIAASTGYLWVITYMAVPIAAFLWIRQRATPGRVAVVCAGILCAGVIFSSLYMMGGGVAAGPSGEISLTEDPLAPPVKSDIFVVNGSKAYAGEFSDLISLMNEQGLSFYQLSGPGAPAGLIGKNDVVLIKINCQWPERGGTNTDLVRAVIAAILAHPEGFGGEIVVADNGQGRGSFEWAEANAEDTTQSIQDVVDSYATDHRVSTYLWDTIRSLKVDEYDQGSDQDGYIMNDTINPRTHLKVTYPKFTTVFGTKISLRKGIWEDGAYNNAKLKLINMPVLKTHSGPGVTASLKHYVGVVSVALDNPHDPMWYGGLGTAFVETRYPDITILDATWVNAIPKGYAGAGPLTPYEYATRVDQILASTDPVALDYFAAKHLLMPLAASQGYSTASMDPDTTSAGTFGTWLRVNYNEIRDAGYPVTMNETQMFIHYREPVGFPPEISGLFRPSTHTFYLDWNGNGRWDGAATDRACNFGLNGDLPVPGDWDGTGKTSIGVFRPSTHTFYLDWNGNGVWDGGVTDRAFYFGMNGDIPVSGDWNSLGRTCIGVFRPSTHTFYLDWNGNGRWDGGATDRACNFGLSGDLPVPGDWDGLGTPSIGVFRPSTSTFYLDYNKNGRWDGTRIDRQYSFGLSGDIPVAGDWDGFGTTSIGVYRPSTHTFYLDYNGNKRWDGAATDRAYTYGLGGDAPVAGKWS